MRCIKERQTNFVEGLKVQKPKICFVSLCIYPLLKKENSNIEHKYKYPIGGAELQQLLIGQELARRGYRVSYITWDHGQKRIEKFGSFTVISTYKPSEGIPILRFFYPRLTKIWGALRKSEADIYYVRAATFILAVVVLFAKLYHKKVVFCGASTLDFQPLNPSPPTIRDNIVHFRDTVLYEWGLKRSDAVVVQNRAQKRLLQENCNIEGHIIHNGLPRINHEVHSNEIILWTGTIKEHRRSEMFVELAKRLPEEKFVMIGGSRYGQEELYNHILEEARRLPNLDFKGFLPFTEVEKQFMRTKLFINTSEYEGFPNTFLQSWRRGIPVISFVDPDNLIIDYHLGIVVKDIEEITQKVKDIVEGKVKLSSKKIKSYFEQHLTIERMVDGYEKLFDSLKINNVV